MAKNDNDWLISWKKKCSSRKTLRQKEKKKEKILPSPRIRCTHRRRLCNFPTKPSKLNKTSLCFLEKSDHRKRRIRVKTYAFHQSDVSRRILEEQGFNRESAMYASQLHPLNYHHHCPVQSDSTPEFGIETQFRSNSAPDFTKPFVLEQVLTACASA